MRAATGSGAERCTRFCAECVRSHLQAEVLSTAISFVADPSGRRLFSEILLLGNLPRRLIISQWMTTKQCRAAPNKDD